MTKESKEQAVRDAYYTVSKTDHEVGKVEAILREAKEKYKDALLDEVVFNILNMQKDGEITEMALKMMINDVIYRVLDVNK